MLVGSDGRGIDRDDPVQVAFGAGLGEQGGEDLLLLCSQVPSAAHSRRRLWVPFHEPKCPGRSLHGVPVRYLNAVASNTRLDRPLVGHPTVCTIPTIR
ncbi:hypothetical protein ADL04_00575 [Streptomyces sp. NRRL B-3648]|nr:hypothetical protein ADL04_00575 [Streptomyces sp. NRRL B-3648]